MNFSAKDICGMLEEYKNDHLIDMDIKAIANLIYDYTGGYPFLVSRLCQLVDEEITKNGQIQINLLSWTKEDILTAVKKLLEEQNTLFDDMGKKLADSSELNQMLRLILFNGKKIPYSPDEYAINLGNMFGYLKNEDGSVAIANRIFETRLYNRYLTEDMMENAIADAAVLGRNQFVASGFLDMDLVMEKYFNKKKTVEMKKIHCNGKTIIEVVV